MGRLDAGITLHIHENTTHNEREEYRSALLGLDGVMAAAYHDNRPHLMVIVYDPERVKSVSFIDKASDRGLHVELIA